MATAIGDAPASTPVVTASPRRASAFRPDVQGLRALAVAPGRPRPRAASARSTAATSGSTSSSSSPGFLITGLLLAEAGRTGRVSLLGVLRPPGPADPAGGDRWSSRHRRRVGYLVLDGIDALRLLKDSVWATLLRRQHPLRARRDRLLGAGRRGLADPALLVAGRRGAVLPAVAAARAPARRGRPPGAPGPPCRRRRHRRVQPRVVRLGAPTDGVQPAPRLLLARRRGPGSSACGAAVALAVRRRRAPAPASAARHDVGPRRLDRLRLGELSARGHRRARGSHAAAGRWARCSCSRAVRRPTGGRPAGARLRPVPVGRRPLVLLLPVALARPDLRRPGCAARCRSASMRWRSSASRSRSDLSYRFVENPFRRTDRLRAVARDRALPRLGRRSGRRRARRARRGRARSIGRAARPCPPTTSARRGDGRDLLLLRPAGRPGPGLGARRAQRHAGAQPAPPDRPRARRPGGGRPGGLRVLGAARPDAALRPRRPRRRPDAGLARRLPHAALDPRGRAAGEAVRLPGVLLRLPGLHACAGAAVVPAEGRARRGLRLLPAVVPGADREAPARRRPDGHRPAALLPRRRRDPGEDNAGVAALIEEGMADRIDAVKPVADRSSSSATPRGSGSTPTRSSSAVPRSATASPTRSAGRCSCAAPSPRPRAGADTE